MHDIYIHTEGNERVAYQEGREIARMTPMGYERFLVALHQWIRRHGQSRLWEVDAQGAAHPAEKIEKEMLSRQSLA